MHDAVGMDDMPSQGQADTLVSQAHPYNIGVLFMNSWITVTDIPASVGVRGPDETTICAGPGSWICSRVIRALRYTPTSWSSPPK